MCTHDEERKKEKGWRGGEREREKKRLATCDRRGNDITLTSVSCRAQRDFCDLAFLSLLRGLLKLYLFVSFFSPFAVEPPLIQHRGVLMIFVFAIN